MGHKYTGLYNIGDTFTGEYLFGTYNFHIIGFLDEGCTVSNSLMGKAYLDNYIIMPSFEIQGIIPESDSLKFHYANKTSGMIKVTPEKSQEAIELLSPLIENTPAGSYSWDSSSLPSNFQQTVGLNLNTCYIWLFAISALLIVVDLIYANRYAKTLYFTKIFSLKNLLNVFIFTVLAILCSYTMAYPIQIFFSIRVSFIKYAKIPLFVSLAVFALIALSLKWQRRQSWTNRHGD